MLVFFLNSCTDLSNIKISNKENFISNFTNSGFALIYNDNLFKQKIVNKKMNERDLLIFQKNLKKDTPVKILNPINNKYVIAKVGKNSIYPSFNNSVISIRIFKEIDLDINEPYILITEIQPNSTFVAKKAKTFEVEKTVANKAPVESISINNLNSETNESKSKVIKRDFNYSIKIADFYFEKSAQMMISRINSETFSKSKLSKISENKYRVYLGPYLNLNSLQKAYNSVEKLNFENIEILKND